MREEIPYDFEIIPQNQSFWIFNNTSWAGKDCIVNITGPNISQKYILKGSKKYLEITGLRNGVAYHLKITRKNLLGKLKYRAYYYSVTPSDIDSYTVLIGASVGKSWKLRELAARKSIDNHFFGFRGQYDFDKTKVIDSLVRSPIKPNQVIIKECAAYFPRDTYTAISQIKSWTQQLQKADINPILATVVPITENLSKKNPGQLESINNFNKAIRSLGEENSIPVLDLQNALSSDAQKGYLNETYSSEDGLHLKPSTYIDQLDNFLLNFLEITSKQTQN